MASQDLSTTGLEESLPASGPIFERAFHDWFFSLLFLRLDSHKHRLANPPDSIGDEFETTS